MNVFLYFLQTFTINFYFQCLIGHGQVVMCCLIRTPEMITQIQETTTCGNTNVKVCPWCGVGLLRLLFLCAA